MTLRRLALHQLHKNHGAIFGDYFGWNMPMTYESCSTVQQVKHCRSHALVFDVSHMMKLKWKNQNAAELARSIFPSKFCPKKLGLSVFLKGHGIIDDVVVKLDETKSSVLTVSNCSRRQYVSQYLTERGVRFEEDERTLLAVQGPKASVLLSQVFPGVEGLRFMEDAEFPEDVCVARCGYTGEDGFEITLPPELASAKIIPHLLRGGALLGGLSARNMLRIEAGMNLYGHEMDEDTTPFEAGIGWLVDKERRDLDPLLLDQVRDKSRIRKRRVGIATPSVRRPLRDGTVLLAEDQSEVGTVTSGTALFSSPSTPHGIGMAFVAPAFAKIGTKLYLKGGSGSPAQVVKLPHVANKFVK